MNAGLFTFFLKNRGKRVDRELSRRQKKILGSSTTGHLVEHLVTMKTNKMCAVIWEEAIFVKCETEHVDGWRHESNLKGNAYMSKQKNNIKEKDDTGTVSFSFSLFLSLFPHAFKRKLENGRKSTWSSKSFTIQPKPEIEKLKKSCKKAKRAGFFK